MTTATATAKRTEENATSEEPTSEEPTSSIDRAIEKAASWRANEQEIRAESDQESWALLIQLLKENELSEADERELAQSIVDLNLTPDQVKFCKAAIAKVRRLTKLHDDCQAALDEKIKLRNDRVVIEKLTKKQLEEALTRQLKADNRYGECCRALEELKQMKHRSPMLFAGDDSTPPRLHRLDSKQ